MISFFPIGRVMKKEEFMRLLDIRMPVLYKIAFSYFKNEDKASDAVQDSILTAYKSLDKLKDKEKFNSWITTILVNRCREILRREGKFILEEISDEVIPIDRYSFQGRHEDEYSKADSRMDVLNLLQRVEEKYREVITLKYLGDCTIEEISRILSIPEGTVKSRLNFGINKLRRLMEVKDSAL